MTKDKRARIIQELNNLKNLDEGDDAKSVNSLQWNLCAGSKELHDISKQLKQEVADKRQHVIELLKDLVPDDAGTVSPPEIDVHINPVKKHLNDKVSENAVVRVAGNVNIDRCDRCEELDDEEVCGDNGKTYRTLCHAVNCAGLALKDISAGSCALKVIL